MRIVIHLHRQCGLFQIVCAFRTAGRSRFSIKFFE